MASQVEVELLVFGYLLDETDKLKHGWGRNVRARKKHLRRQMRQGWRALRNLGVLGQHRKRSPYVIGFDDIKRSIIGSK